MSIENFKSWAIQSMAMLQSVLWNGLSYLGYGVNIQHFNKELESYCKQTFKLQNHWKLLAQMNIGISTKKQAERKRLPMEHLLSIHK
jgi:predicted oxidoreductase (fatty acid repression mutant protein)